MSNLSNLEAALVTAETPVPGANIAEMMELYKFAVKLHPQGFYGNDFIPLNLNGAEFQLRYFTDRGHNTDVEFRIALENRRYARCTFIVYDDGRVAKDLLSEIPDWDQGSADPQLPADDAQLLREIYIAVLRLAANAAH